MEKPPVCKYCAFYMEVAWSGDTPAGSHVVDYVCPNCFSNYVIGDLKDPYYKFLSEFISGQLRYYEEKTRTSKQ